MFLILVGLILGFGVCFCATENISYREVSGKIQKIGPYLKQDKLSTVTLLLALRILGGPHVFVLSWGAHSAGCLGRTFSGSEGCRPLRC